jgi:DNA helicase HerA-like ATPase
LSIPRTKKVITSSRFSTNESSALLNTESTSRALRIGNPAADDSSSWSYLGKVCEQSGGSNILDYAVWYDLEFPHVVGIFGTRGTGKSFDLGVFVEGIGGLEGVTTEKMPSAATVVFDVQNQFWTLGLKPDTELSEDRDHIELIDNWGLKPQSLSSVSVWLPAGTESALPESKDFRLSPSQLERDDWLALLEIERYSPIGQALLTLVNDCPGAPPAELAKRCSPSKLDSFQKGTVQALQWRLEALAESDLVGKPGIEIEELLSPGQTSVVLLRDLGESLRALTVGVVTRLVENRMSQYHQEKRIVRRHKGSADRDGLPDRVWTVVDEAHVMVPADGQTAATDPVVDYVKRGRDAGLSMIFASQQPSAVDSRLLSQVDVTLTHALAFETDLQAAVARMPTRTSVSYKREGFELPTLRDTIRSFKPGEVMVADSSNGRVFTAQVRPRLSAHGGNVPPVEKES